MGATLGALIMAVIWVKHEMSKLTPKQKAAIEQLEAANAAAQATSPPGM